VEHEVFVDHGNACKKSFPPGLSYKIIYDPTIFVGKSVNEVIKTIFVAIFAGRRRGVPVFCRAGAPRSFR